MSYDHTLTAEILFKPNTTLHAIVHALSPLISHFDWDIQKLLANELPYDDTIDIAKINGEVSGMEIYICGDTLPNYEEALQAFAQNLSPIAKTSHMVLKNYDSAELEEAITLIWFGPETEIIHERKLYAYSEAVRLLEAAEVSQSAINIVKSLMATEAESV